jgi:hypothetical protein
MDQLKFKMESKANEIENLKNIVSHEMRENVITYERRINSYLTKREKNKELADSRENNRGEKNQSNEMRVLREKQRSIRTFIQERRF